MEGGDGEGRWEGEGEGGGEGRRKGKGVRDAANRQLFIQRDTRYSPTNVTDTHAVSLFGCLEQL